MIDYHYELVNALKTILPTHYEMTLTSKTTTPCISYMEINNYVSINGETLGYSRIAYQIKVEVVYMNPNKAKTRVTSTKVTHGTSSSLAIIILSDRRRCHYHCSLSGSKRENNLLF